MYNNIFNFGRIQNDTGGWHAPITHIGREAVNIADCKRKISHGSVNLDKITPPRDLADTGLMSKAAIDALQVDLSGIYFEKTG